MSPCALIHIHILILINTKGVYRDASPSTSARSHTDIDQAQDRSGESPSHANLFSLTVGVSCKLLKYAVISIQTPPCF